MYGDNQHVSYQHILDSLEKNSEHIYDAIKRDLRYIFWETFANEINAARTESDVVKALCDLFDPAANNFTVGSIQDIPENTANWIDSHEVWTDSRAYLIRIGSKTFEKIVNYL